MSRIIRLAQAAIFVVLILLVIFHGLASAGNSLFINPLPGKYLVRYGRGYIEPDNGIRRVHHGLDIASSEGAIVKAAADGTVAFAGHVPAGYCVTVRHENGVKTTYLPLAGIAVKAGDHIGQGGKLGMVAAAGDKSTAASHLHVGAVFAGDYIDPETLFRGTFVPDYSKIIRRGNLPPDAERDNLPWESAAPDAGGTSIIAGVIAGGNEFIEQLVGGFRGTFRWLGGVGAAAFNFSRRRLGMNPAINPAIFGRVFLRGSGTGVRVFDPSGDAGEVDSKIVIETGRASTVTAVEVYNRDATRVKYLPGWNHSGGAYIWLGDDDNGNIVPEGLYAIIIRRPGAQVESLLAEVRWHL